MKFISKRFVIKIEPTEIGTFKVEQISGPAIIGEITLEYLKEHFEPGDCNALRLVDPDRNERIV